MSRFVKYGDHLYSGNPFDDPQPQPPKPGVCAWCGGTGFCRDTIDDERPDVLGPCQMCRRFCKTCGKYRKVGHQCSR